MTQKNIVDNKVHHTRRSRDSNFLTTFIDNNSEYFSHCTKFTNKSSNLNHFYNYFYKKYQKFSSESKVLIEEIDIPQGPELDVYLDNISSVERLLLMPALLSVA